MTLVSSGICPNRGRWIPCISHGRVRLHYRLRFDPAGLPEPSRRTLREATGDWMLQLRRGRTRRPDADSAAKTP